ncbi:MAG: hypothetical protein JNL79_20065, partial [Myxococcales bacterium]|nr:hypothetical protein [Myxococcales bacterium]
MSRPWLGWLLALTFVFPPACSKKDDDTSAESKDDDAKKKKKKKAKAGDDDDDDAPKKKKKKAADDDDDTPKKAKADDDDAPKKKKAADDDDAPKKKKKKSKAIDPDDDKNPIPDDWTTIYDEAVGYEFKVPVGTPAMKLSTHNGISYYTTQTPKPHQIDLALAVFKDATLSKGDVQKKSKSLLEGFGDKDVWIGIAKDKGADYSVADFTSLMASGDKRNKGVVLVALDKSDNYVLYVSSDDASYLANKDTI